MKKLITLLIAVIVLAFNSNAIANDMYIGVGGTYAIEDFNTNVDFDNTEGLNLKTGYKFDKNISIELSYDYLPGFTWTDGDISAEADIETLMLAVKITAGDKVKPYLTGGAGLMRGDLNVSYLGQSVSVSENGMCAKTGIGIDYFIKDNISIGFESSYIWGLNDMDGVDYVTVTYGIAYHF